MISISDRAKQGFQLDLIEIKARLSDMASGGVETVDFTQASVHAYPSAKVLSSASCGGDEDEQRRLHNRLIEPSHGFTKLRKQIADYRRATFKDKIDENNVLITAGGNHAFLLACLTLWNPGDTVLVPTPYFFNMVENLRLSGIRTLACQLIADNGFTLSNNAVVDAWSAEVRGLAIVNPSNPTGAHLDNHQAAEIQSFIRGQQACIVVDETYFEFLPATEQIKRCWQLDSTIVIGSFSKSFSLIGDRVGYMIADMRLIAAFRKALDSTLISAGTLPQIAASAALEQRDSVATVRKLAEERRSKLLNLLKEFPGLFPDIILFDCPVFAFVRVNSKIGVDTLCESLLEVGVGVGKGRWFGDNCKEFIRICCCSPSGQKFEHGLSLMRGCFQRLSVMNPGRK